VVVKYIGDGGVMTDFLAEVAVISFTLGGIVGAIVALTLSVKKKSAAESAAEEKAQDILHP
jgi:esterase/lipase